MYPVAPVTNTRNDLSAGWDSGTGLLDEVPELMAQTLFEGGAAEPVTGLDQPARNRALACRGQLTHPLLAEQQCRADIGHR